MTIPIEYLAIVGGALAAAIGVLFRMVIANYVEQIKELKSEIASLKSIANANLFTAESAAAQHVLDMGEKPLPILAPVIAESNSPPTEKQSITANIATMRARTVAARLAIGLPPMDLPEHEAKKENWIRKMLPPYSRD